MKPRIISVEYIRGLGMLGVVGIHTGAWSLTNPDANIHLFALLEIVSRFSVPIFFFVSAFALFRQYPLEEPFAAGHFFQRRFRHVLIPYAAWSIFYMLHYSFANGDWSIWFPRLVYNYVLFGAASYQLYFLVILLWFYLLMPLWRSCVRRILQNPASCLCAILLLQVAFNYYSSYVLRPHFTNYYANLFIEYRMSYWPFHYVFLFLLGGVFAARYDEVLAWLRRNRLRVSVLFWLSMASVLVHYYYLLFVRQVSPEQAVNLAHQLSPAGVLYSVMACLYLVLRFESPLPNFAAKLLSMTGHYSYGIFLIHPLFMFYFSQILGDLGLLMTAPVTIVFYLSTVLCSLAYAVAAESVWNRLRS